MRIKSNKEMCDSETLRRIATRREELNMKQSDLARVLGYTSRSTVSRVENGTLPLPVRSIHKWAVALQTTDDYLLHTNSSSGGSLDVNSPIVDKIVGYCRSMSRKEQEMFLEIAELVIRYRNK